MGVGSGDAFSVVMVGTCLCRSLACQKCYQAAYYYLAVPSNMQSTPPTVITVAEPSGQFSSFFPLLLSLHQCVFLFILICFLFLWCCCWGWGLQMDFFIYLIIGFNKNCEMKLKSAFL